MQQQIYIDKDIVEKCRKGNLQDFRQLVLVTTPFAFSVAFRMLGEEEQSRDVVQETMITMWKTIRKIKDARNFNMWFYRIVVNKCYDQLRKRKRNPEFRPDERVWELIANKISVEPSDGLEMREMSQIINILTDKLSPKQKAVFVLSDLEDMSGEEIAGITGMTRINVKANLYYARKRIGEMISRFV